MLDKVKTALRLKTSAFDGEIDGLIDACKADLSLAGIKIKEKPPRAKKWVDDPLVVRAVILYCKANFGFNEDSERYRRAYDLLKTALCLAGEYIAVE